jgi:hypothetical protein
VPEAAIRETAQGQALRVFDRLNDEFIEAEKVAMASWATGEANDPPPIPDAATRKLLEAELETPNAAVASQSAAIRLVIETTRGALNGKRCFDRTFS